MQMLDVGSVDMTDTARDARHDMILDFFRTAHRALACDGVSYGLIVVLPGPSSTCGLGASLGVHVKVGVGATRETVEHFARNTYPDALAVEITEMRSLH